MQSLVLNIAAMRRRGAVCLALLVSAGCASATTGPSVNAVVLPGGSALVFKGATATAEQRPRIEQLVRAAVVEARKVIPLDGITVSVRYGNSGGFIPQFGFGGRADAGTVAMTIDPDSPVWVESLDTEFFRILAHELHHVARFRAVGFNDNLLEAIVTEGLADQFMVELAGGNPPIWASALEGAELDTWLKRAREVWLEPGLDRSAWFNIGVQSPVPQWAGYAVGFEITGRFLGDNPSRRASTLVAEPATSFIPAD